MLSMFDQYGSLRLTVEFGPTPEPILTIYEKTDPNSADLGIYALDPTGSKEVVVKHVFSSTQREGAIAWLAHRMSAATAPVSLLDQRGKVLWQYRPSVQ